MRRFFTLTVILVSTLFLCGCPVHQWPEPRLIVKGTIHLKFIPDMWVWEHLVCNTETGEVREVYPDADFDGSHPGTTDWYINTVDHGTMRYFVRAYHPYNLSVPAAEAFLSRDVADGYDCDIEMDLDAGEYLFVVWADIFESETDSPFYDATDFHSVVLQFEEYMANTDYRDAFRGVQSARFEYIDTRETNVEQPYTIEIEMRRPMAKFQFISTDLSEFLQKEASKRDVDSDTRVLLSDYVVRFHYTGNLPISYRAVDDRLENVTTGVRFDSEIVPIEGNPDGEVSLGFDYVLISDSDNVQVPVRVEILHVDGERVALTPEIYVPLRRSHHTILRGEFMSTMSQGGVTIDPEYDGDHNFVFGGGGSWESNPKN